LFLVAHVPRNADIGKWLGKSPILEQLHTSIRWSLKVWSDGITEKVGWHVVKEYPGRFTGDECSAS